MKQRHELHHMGEERFSWVHHFTREELEGFAAEMAEGNAAIGQLEAEKKAAADDFKQRIESEERAVRIAARNYREKQEHRDAVCHKFADYNTGEIVWKDKESGEERGRRPMTAEERQVPLIPKKGPDHAGFELEESMQ